MPRANAPGGSAPRRVKRRPTTAGRSLVPPKQAAKANQYSRRVVRMNAVKDYRQKGPKGVSARQEAIALRTMARNATSKSEWKRIQEASPTDYAMPQLEQNIARNRESQKAPRQSWTVGRGGGAVPAAAQSKDKMSVGEAWGWLVKDIASVKIPKPLQDANRALSKVMPAGEAIYQAQKLMGTDRQIGVAPIDLIPIGGLAAREGRYAIRAGGRLLRKGGKTVEVGVKEAEKLSRSGARIIERPKPTPKVKPAPKPKPEPTAIKRPFAKVEDATAKAKAVGKTKFEALPKPARVGAKVATWPVRGRAKVLKLGAVGAGANVAGQVPAAISSGDASKLTEPLTNPQAGVLKPVIGQVASVAPGQVAENFLKDLFELPVAIIPSIFLTGKAVVQAGQGDSEMLDAMVKDYVENGFLPNIVKGDIQGARRSFEQHPLYAALTARGVYAGIGRGAGIAARTGALGKKVKGSAGTKRPDLKVGAGQVEEQRYSPNLFTKSVQVAIEKNKQKKGLDPNHVLNRRGGASKQARLQQKAAVHEVTAEEGLRRMKREQAQEPMIRETTGLRKLGPTDWSTPKSLRNVAVLFIDGSVRSERTWRQDLNGLREQYRTSLRERRASGDLTKREEAQTLGLIRDIGVALKRATDRDAAEMMNVRAAFRQGQDKTMGEVIQKGIFADEQFRTARARPFAVAQMGARWDARFNNGKGKPKGALVDPQGRKLSLAAIEAQMKREGVEPGFVTQTPGFRGAKGNFYQPLSYIAGRRGKVGKQNRTGLASERGTFDATMEAAVEQLVSTQTLASRLQGFDRVLNQFVVRDGATSKPRYFKNFDDARMAADDPESFGLPTDAELMPVRITPIGSKSAERDSAIQFLENSNRFGDDTRSLERLDQEAVARLTRDGPGEVVLVPRKVFDTVESLARPQNTLTRIVASLSNAFKGVILPVSPRWLIGNAVDPALRSLLAGLTPVDWLTGRKVLAELRKMDPDEANRIDSVLTGGTQYGAASRLRIKRSQPNQWGDSDLASNALLGWLKFRNAPGVKSLGNAYARYRDFMYRYNSQIFERQPQVAALGKEARRRLSDLDGDWRKSLGIGKGAYEDLAKGLLNSKTQRAYALSIERVFGSWNRLSRLEKDVLANYVPFGLWIRAAYQYVAVTLPVHHPIKVAVGVQLAQMTEQERQELGLSLTVDKRLPDYLQGSIPLGGGKILPIQAFTSFGMFADIPKQLGRAVLPQYEGIKQGLDGLDWLGNDLVNKDGKVLSQEERLALAAANLAEVTIPTIALGFRLATGNNPTSLIAVPPYKRDDEPKSARIVQWAGYGPMSRQEVKDSIKWRQSYSIGVPGVPDIGQKKVRKSGGSSSSSKVANPNTWLK